MVRRYADSPLRERWFSIVHAAEYADVHVDTVKRAIWAGELRAYRPSEGRHWRIRSADLDLWLMGREGSAS